MQKAVFPVIAMCVALSGCGDTSRDNDLIGQAKKVVMNTPLICPDYASVDVSLGVMRGGVGSMSTQDVWMTVGRNVSLDGLRKAVDSGAIIKVHYDVRRITFCVEDHILTSYEILPN